MAQTLQKYTTGSFAGLFDQKTNVELGNQLVVFQIRDLEDQLRPIAIYIVLNFLWNRIRAEMKKRILVIDEAWNLMQYEDSARFLFGIVKRARKYYLGVTTITQDVDDFVESPFGRPIITNSSMQFLLKQSPATIDSLQKLFYLTDGEKYALLNSDVGQGVLFAGYKHVAMEVIASPEEAAFVTTKPEEVMAQQAAGKAEKARKGKLEPLEVVAVPEEQKAALDAVAAQTVAVPAAPAPVAGTVPDPRAPQPAVEGLTEPLAPLAPAAAPAAPVETPAVSAAPVTEPPEAPPA